MFDTLWQQLMAQSAMEMLAVVCSLAYVHFATKQHLVCWPFALASTGIYTWLFWETSLFFQSILNAWYLIMAIYGWFNWKNMAKQEEPGISSWGIKSNLLIVLGLLLASYVCFQLLSLFVEEKMIFLDLNIAVFSAFVTWMLTHKVLENWLYWVVINALTAWLCLQQDLLLSAALFTVYIFYSVKGYVKWRKEGNLLTSS